MHNLFARHDRVALSFSGGKDSTACLELFRDELDRITVYHLDTGDLIPEIADHVAFVATTLPHFVRIQGNVLAWHRKHGLPSDLVPYTSHPVGRLMGHGSRLVPRFDCCYLNLMLPVFERIKADGNTALIRGSKKSDMPRLPIAEGAAGEGVEMHYPLLDWSDLQVLTFLRERGVTVPRLYNHLDSAPDCARCSAWWSERRNDYLHAHYPELWLDYQDRLHVVRAEIKPLLYQLDCETRTPRTL